MKEFEKKRIIPYVVAVEYKIDYGVLIDHSGDLLCFDGVDMLTVVEVKCLKNHYPDIKEKRLTKVKEQTDKLYKRLNSWIKHLLDTNPSLEKLKYMETKAAYFTDETGLVYI